MSLWPALLSPGPCFGETVYEVPLMRAASYPNQQGFVRVISLGEEEGTVEIHAWDDTGMHVPEPALLTLPPGATVPFNSRDLEEGNEEKGLLKGIGTGTGDWHLQLRSETDFEAGAYMRTEDGFLTSMGSALLAYRPESLGLNHGGCAYKATIFNPAQNPNQRSWLRLINYGLEAAEVAIEGFDEEGARRGPVTFEVPPGEAFALTAVQLEEGDVRVTGALGDGKGKWRLIVVSEDPLTVMNLLETPTGHLTNLGPMTMPGFSDAALPLAEVGCEFAPPFILSTDG